MDKRLPGISDLEGKKVTLLDVAETFGDDKVKRQIQMVRLILLIYRSLKRISQVFDQDDNMILAESCSFRPGQRGRRPDCTGGVADFVSDDGARRLLEHAREMESAFPTYDLSGEPVSPAHRWLQSGCTAIFRGPDCIGGCGSCSGRTATAKCRARMLKCKGQSIQGLSFPFSK